MESATVTDSIVLLAKDVQQVFDDLMKLVLRKTLRPTLNPLGSNTLTSYNTRTQKYATTVRSSNPDFGVDKYIYTMIVECIGWCGDSMSTFKAISKIIKSDFPERHPQGAAQSRNTRLVRNRVVYSGRQQKDAAKGAPTGGDSEYRRSRYEPSRSDGEYRRFIEFISAKNMQNIIANRKSSFAYTCDIPYMDCFKQLANVGDDIVNQTDPEIMDDSGLPTFSLRNKLDKLETDLTMLLETNQDIYCSFIEMIYIINSIDRSQLSMLINLIANLSYQSWDDLPVEDMAKYIDYFGETFIDQFNANQLITILLQDDASEVILTSSYMYSLLKMLFPVFGYTNLTPNVVLGSCGCGCCEQQGCNCAEHDPCDYSKVTYFQTMYPVLVSIISNIECIPAACPETNCETIPQTYQDLCSINEYFWRFDGYSYCQYVQYNAEKQMVRSLGSKVSDKTRFLKAL